MGPCTRRCPGREGGVHPPAPWAAAPCAGLKPAARRRGRRLGRGRRGRPGGGRRRVRTRRTASSPTPRACARTSCTRDGEQGRAARRGRDFDGAGANAAVRESFVGFTRGWTRQRSRTREPPAGGRGATLPRVGRNEAEQAHPPRGGVRPGRRLPGRTLRMRARCRPCRRCRLSLAPSSTLAAAARRLDPELDLWTALTHSSPDADSAQDVPRRGRERGCSVQGADRVPQLGQRTNADQLCRPLFWTTARPSTRCPLEIVADDVKCTHGATVADLDESILPRGRGLARADAQALLIKDSLLRACTRRTTPQRYLDDDASHKEFEDRRTGGAVLEH